MFNFGDVVKVKAFRNEVLTRRVVGTNGANTVYLCNENEFQAARKEDREPTAIGFPMGDILEKSEAEGN